MSKYRKAIGAYKARKKFQSDFNEFKKIIENCEYYPEKKSKKAVAVLLSYKRPQNMQWITKSLLTTNFISRVIVSNNNPDLRMEDWFDYSDDRVELLNQKVRRRAGYRFEIAKDLNDQYFIFIDDDLFLKPSQLSTLFDALLSNPSVPHGVWGQRFINNNNELSWEDGVRNINGELDVINRSYFLTRKHVENFIKLMNSLGIHQVTDLKFGDDMILSFSGDGRPICHDVGNLLDCISKDKDGIAIWKENEFFSYRSEMFKKLTSIMSK